MLVNYQFARLGYAIKNVSQDEYKCKKYLFSTFFLHFGSQLVHATIFQFFCVSRGNNCEHICVFSL